MVEGELLLRGAEEPYALQGPTTLSGTNADGALSDVRFTTPTVQTVRAVPEYNTTAEIGAAFSVTRVGTGSINPNGDVVVQLRLAVDLHIVVGILPGSSDCRSAPVDLTLTSTTPYDGESVTLRAPNFTVPPIASSPTCNGLLVGPVNEALAGSGHSLTMTMAGELTVPTLGEPTATSLVVAPQGEANFGEEVTLTATVTPDPEVAGAPPVSGVVSFLHDGTTVGTADLGEDGAATLVTRDLPAGPGQLQAVYGGAPPDWDPSSSALVGYDVIAPPLVRTTAAGEVRIGGDGVDLDVTAVNTGFGADLEDARLKVVLRRQGGTGPIGPAGGTPRIVLDRIDGDDATPIALTHAGSGANQVLTGYVGDATTWLLATSDEHTEALRLAVAAGTLGGPLALTFSLVRGTAPNETVLGTTVGVVTMVGAARLPSTIEAGNPGLPPFFPAIPAITPRVRQGNVAEVGELRVELPSTATPATGTWTATIDGVPVPFQHRDPSLPNGYEWIGAVPVARAGAYTVQVPSTTPTGVRQVTIRYSGDALYAPAQRTWAITVEEAIGTVYDCTMSAIFPVRFTANVEVEATLPPVWAAGRDLAVDRVVVRLRISRTSLHQSLLNLIDDDGKDWRLELGPRGTLTPSEVTGSNSTPMDPTGAGDTDHLIEIKGSAGVLDINPVPGSVEAYALDAINITATPGGFSAGFLCSPAGEPYTIGTVTSAGTALAVEPGEFVGAGAPVALTATALPAGSGSVEFRDGATTIGVVPVDSAGVARMSTRTLPAGTRSLTARFFGGVVATSPSVPVELRVIGECPAFLDEGSGAVVRLVYLELLGRCPDAAGYAFWVGRLDGGVTPEVFARSIASTPEAVGRVVDDAYRTMLGRPADGAGRTFWTGRLLGHGRYDQLLADLGASPEFWSKAGSTDAGFVTRVYDRLLHRAPDAAGLDYWTGRLAGGTSPRVLVLTLANLDEPLGVLVTDSYGEILDRVPDAGERIEGITFLRSTGDRSGLYAQLIGTGEFDDRAQGFPGA